jgi:hypothetical protein
MSAGPTEVNANTVTRQPGYRRITLLLPSIIATAVYSDDSDLDSKSTFPMLGQLAQLRAGDAKSVAPVLTLPASCINYLPGSDFTLSNAVFSGQNGVWLKFTASELKPQSK